MLKITTKIILALSFAGILSATTGDSKDIKTVRSPNFQELQLCKKEAPPSWTCPICGKTFEKPEGHPCYEIKSDGTIVRP